MSSNSSSYRHILRSTSIIGGATAVSLIIGLVKMKAIAALMGPAGVGLLGLLNALMMMGSGVIGMAIDTSGVRLLSASVGDRARAARWALWSFAVPLVFVSVAAFWLFQEQIAKVALGDGRYAGSVRWIGLGVAATILSGVQIAIVQSARRMGDFARIRLVSALLAAIISVAAIYYYSASGLIVAVLVTPIATIIVALYLRSNIPPIQKAERPTLAVLRGHWTMLATLGAAVTLTALIGSGSHTAVRAILVQRLDLGQAGLFQASFAISSLNLGLILGAMIADYYPRLSAAGNSQAMERIANQQVHVGLVLAAPALLAISACAPLILSLLYTAEFTGAALLLRLQVAADALRLAGWALGFVLLARNVKLGYFLVEAALSAIFVGFTWLAVARLGIAAAGVGYFLGYVASLGVALAFAARHGVRLDRSNLLRLGTLVLMLLTIAGVSLVSPLLATGLGTIAFAVVAYFSLREIVRIDFPILPAPAMALIRRKLGWQERA